MKESGLLVVDDDRDNLNLIELFFMCEGYRIDCAASGEAALAMLEKNSYPLMLTDLHMPGMNGLQVASAARDRNKEMTILLYTGDGGDDLARSAAEAGISAVYRKPFNLEILLDLVVREGVSRARRPAPARLHRELKLVAGGT